MVQEVCGHSPTEVDPDMSGSEQEHESDGGGFLQTRPEAWLLHTN